MKVIKTGSLAARFSLEHEREFECGKCKSTLRAKAKEGRFVRDVRDGDYITFTCGVCREDIHISAILFAYCKFHNSKDERA